MGKRYIFFSQPVGEGHPHKVADTISDVVLDACLAEDKFSRVACETYVKSNVVIVGGEITTKARLDVEQIARQSIREIGYVNDDDVFHADRVFVNLLLTQQSADIAQGVDARKAKGKKTSKQGAGDQGLMFGYASNETPELMPAPIMFAHRLGRKLTQLRKAGAAAWLRPDAKSQVSVIYEDGKPVGIHQAIGRRPIAAFGNSDGDFEMLEWTTSGTGPRFGMIVHHTDAAREWAYDRTSHNGMLARGLDDAGKRGWTVVDMRQDWQVIYPFQK